MKPLSTTAAPGVTERAEALADAACELHDAAGPGSWSADAVEDAVEAIETTALALADAHPDAAAAMLAIRHQLAQLRAHLDLPPGEPPAAAGPEEEHQEQVVEPTPLRRARPRRGLGPGYQGVRIPPSRTASGR
ncbi:hypothetical protein ACFXPT_37725 [Streptomyces goshikiensis]|uniref:hypothetical protein n=1 Tax=Streptomyces goshikiensis TaxID=1942 RepID=UPI003692C4B6